MNPTIRLLAATPRGWLSGPIGAALFLAIAIAMFVGEPRSGTAALAFYGPMALMSLVEGVRLYRNRGKGAFVGPEGVGTEFDGKVVWRLPWSQFGGYRVVRVKGWEWLRHPERAGVDILDARHVAVGRLPILPGRSAERPNGVVNLNAAFFRELDRHVPEGGPRLPEPRVRPPMKPSAALACLVGGSLGFGLAVATTWFMVQESRSDLGPASPHAWLWQGGGVALQIALHSLSLVALLAGLIDLLRAANIIKPSTPISFPEEGPALKDHELALMLEKPSLDLVSGVRYRTVDPEAMAKRWRQELGIAKFMLGFSLFVVVVMLATGLRDNSTKPADYLWLLLFPGIPGALVLTGLRRTRLRLDSLNDTLIYQDGQLVVVKPDGSHRVFDMPAWKSLKSPFQSGEILRDRQGPYFLDRARLYACEDPLDEELRAG